MERSASRSSSILLGEDLRQSGDPAAQRRPSLILTSAPSDEPQGLALGVDIDQLPPSPRLRRSYPSNSSPSTPQTPYFSTSPVGSPVLGSFPSSIPSSFPSPLEALHSLPPLPSKKLLPPLDCPPSQILWAASQQGSYEEHQTRLSMQNCRHREAVHLHRIEHHLLLPSAVLLSVRILEAVERLSDGQALLHRLEKRRRRRRGKRKRWNRRKERKNSDIREARVGQRKQQVRLRGGLGWDG